MMEDCGPLSFGSSSMDEEFHSCCEEYDDWQDAEESLSEETSEDNEEFVFKKSEVNEAEVVAYSLRTSNMQGEDNDQSMRMALGYDESSVPFSNGHEEFVLECSVSSPEGNNEAISHLNLTLPQCHKENLPISSLRLFEDVDPECLLRLVEEHERDVSECLVRLVENHERDILECSLLSQDHGEDVSDGSVGFSEDCEGVSECSLILSESHESFCSEFCLFSDDHEEEDDGLVLRVFSKGVSAYGDSGLSSGVSGIGVIMEKSHGFTFLQVQKKLNFFVEESIAEHLALMEGLLVALQKGCRKVLSFTDSKELYHLIAKRDSVEDRLLIAFRERIQELADKFESFVLRLVSRSETAKPLQLAREAAGILGQFIKCPACGEDKHQSKMIGLECSHKVCVDCINTYIENKWQSSQIPIKCPDLKCKYSIPNSKCRSFLPSTSFDSLERAMETKAQNCLRIYCPFPDCSILLSHRRSSPLWEASLVQSNNNCIECHKCCRLVCMRCREPWHPSLSCEEFQNLPSEERDAGDVTLHQLGHSISWRVCSQCRQIIELAEGCYQVTCWCGHEFCFSCGLEYLNGVQTCPCLPSDDSCASSPAHSEPETELWSWEFSNPLPETVDGYSEQEKTQLALIQRFLTGGISLENHFCSPTPSPDSYLDIIKDLNQLPWLESFVSVISDNYQEDHLY
ncbi:hypothetical protein HPP92_028555 [Vanilla planifolia]|uniref:RBR-type E3 ubiquitin transferase n=2 Tax=Vanilla planifolia TaxID=51239 RepID=A0A835P713_VANPL|nr:hypothetical protein HPP92_028555 [Vanilla planifolia]